MKKIKVFFVNPKRIKKKSKVKTLGDLIDAEVPDTYEFIHICVKDDIKKMISEHRPEIIFLSQDKSMDALELVKEIKSLQPSTVIFVVLSDMISDETETINEFKTAGAYKCYLSTLVIDTLTHDMYVALNLE